MRLSDMFTLYYLNADNGAANGGAGDAPTTTGDKPAPENNGANNGGQQGDDPNNPKWLPERLDKAKASERRSIFEAAKVKDIDELLKKIELANTYEQSQLTEAQKTTKQIETLTQTVADLTEKLRLAEEAKTKVEQERVSDRVQSKLESALISAKAKEVEDVLVLVNKKYPDRIAKLVNDKGEIDTKAIETLVDDYRKDRPQDFSIAGPGSPSNRGGKVVDPGKASEHDRSVFRNKIRGMA